MSADMMEAMHEYCMSLDCRNWGAMWRTTWLRRRKSQSCRTEGEARPFRDEADDTSGRKAGRVRQRVDVSGRKFLEASRGQEMRLP